MLNIADDAGVRAAFAQIKENAGPLCRSAPHRHAGAFLGVTVQPMVAAQGLRTDRRQLGRSAVWAGHPVRRRRRPRRGVSGSGPGFAAAQSHAGPPADRTDADLQGPARRPRPTADPARSTGNAAGAFQLSAVRFPRDPRDRHQSAAGQPGRPARSGCPRPAGPARCIRLPQLAIEPYPNQHTTSLAACQTATDIVVRAIRPEDEPLIEAHHRTLSEQSIRMRFFSMVKALSRDSLIRLCHLDYAREMALVAERQERRGQAGNHRRVALLHEPADALGRVRRHRARRLSGPGAGPAPDGTADRVARESAASSDSSAGCCARTHRMLALAKDLGFHEGKPVDQGALQVVLDL